MQPICLFLLLLSHQKKKKKNLGTSLVVQWLIPHTHNTGSMGLSLWWANQDPTCAQQGQKKKKNHCQDQYQEACFPVSFLVFLWFQVSGLILNLISVDLFI